jgi:hypothetical protein
LSLAISVAKARGSAVGWLLLTDPYVLAGMWAVTAMELSLGFMVDRLCFEDKREL